MAQAASSRRRRTALGEALNSLGRRTSQTRGNGVVTSYTFDSASRLTGLASDATGTSGDLTLGLGYNPAGQIKSTTRSNDAYSWTGAANVNRGYTANGLNQFTASGATSLGYDARGNLTSSGSDSYTYSSENLLLTGPGGASLAYDPLLRLEQVGNTATPASRFVYDGGNIVAQANTSGVYNRRYVLVPGSDEIVAEYKPMSGQINWKLLDERGSVIAAMGTDGVAGSSNTYDEYGIPGSGNAMRYQYTGQVWLGEAGLYYYKARLYSPTLGRFMQTDPIGYGDGLNWYNYVKGDPVNARDSSGNWCTGSILDIPCGGATTNIICTGNCDLHGDDGDHARHSSDPNSSNAGGDEGTGNSPANPARIINILYVPGDITINGANSKLLSNYGFQNIDFQKWGPSFGIPTGARRGVILSDRRGGWEEAVDDLDTLAKWNNITPLGNRGFTTATPAGWVMLPLGGLNFRITNISGLQLRATNGQIHIDIPAGFTVGTGFMYRSPFGEVVHYGN